MKNRRQRIREIDDGLKRSLERLKKLFDSIDERIDSLKNKLNSEKQKTSEQRRVINRIVGRFIAYDKARDRFVDFLQKELEKAGVDYESSSRWAKLHMDQDEKFCKVREVCREAKNDPDLMWC